MNWMLLPYKRYFDFNGRSRRQEYWMFTLLGVLVTLACSIFMVAGGLSLASGDVEPEFGATFFLGAVVLGLFVLASVLPGIAVTVRRLHDRDMSGWWYLAAIVIGTVPYIGFLASIALFVVMVLPGTPGPNRFGPDPLDPTNATVFA